jgi:hypothetical protein
MEIVSMVQMVVQITDYVTSLGHIFNHKILAVLNWLPHSGCRFRLSRAMPRRYVSNAFKCQVWLLWLLRGLKSFTLKTWSFRISLLSVNGAKIVEVLLLEVLPGTVWLLTEQPILIGIRNQQSTHAARAMEILLARVSQVGSTRGVLSHFTGKRSMVNAFSAVLQMLYT